MKTALFTVSFNRPDLMQQLLSGLKENLEDLDVSSSDFDLSGDGH